MDFQSAMETFAEAWVAANGGPQTQALALTRSKSPILLKRERSPSPVSSPPLRQTPINRIDSISEKLNTNSLENSRSPIRYNNSLGGNCIGNEIAATGNIKNDSPVRNENIVASLSNRNTPIQRDISHQKMPFQHNHQPQQQQQQQQQQLHGLQHSLGQNLNVSNSKRCAPLSMLENGLNNCQGQGITNEKIHASPSLDRKDFDFAKVNAKSLPLHCIVESVPSLQASLTIDTRNLWKRRPNIEIDSYVIIASSTPWSEIVSTALQRLGYSIDIANTARGSVIIKNWKPIPLENISDNPVVPVSDILGELTSVVTLRILILRTKPTTFGEIKDKLLKLLVLQSHAVLRSTGCPLDEVMLSQICRGSCQNSFSYNGEIPEELKRKFDQWWNNQLSPQSPLPPATPKMLPSFMNSNQSQPNELDFPTPGHVAAAAAVAAAAVGNHGNLHASSRESLLAAASESHHHHSHHPGMLVHPALHSMHSQYPASQKTRMRTSFDPEMELPKLQRWFQENPHPSRQQIQSYVIQLNSLESRRGRKPLDVNNVVYWFKNARAAQKRAEVRGQGILGNGYIHHSMSGLGNNLSGNSSLLSSADFIKSPPLNDDIDQVSQHSDDDMEEEINSVSRANSPPQLPLSLTMHERNRSSSDSISIKEESDQMNGDFIERNNNESIINGAPNNSQKDSRSPVDMNQDESTKENNNNVASKENEDNSAEKRTNNNEHMNSPKDLHVQHSSSTPTKSDEDLDMDDDDDEEIDDYHSPSPRRDLSFPMVPNSMFSHPIMYYGMGAAAAAAAAASGGMGHPHPSHHGLTPVGLGPHGGLPSLCNIAGASPNSGSNNLNLSNLSNDERRKRNRTFIDPVTEVPKLEQWFALNTHPSHNQILKYTEDLNRMPYRQKFPRLESKNVQFWFKNRRAKCKRLKMSLYDAPQQCPQLSSLSSFGHKYDDRD